MGWECFVEGSLPFVIHVDVVYGKRVISLVICFFVMKLVSHFFSDVIIWMISLLMLACRVCSASPQCSFAWVLIVGLSTVVLKNYVAWT